jgi:hypothetical protein
LKRFAVMILTCAFSALLIAEISSVIIVKFHSQQFQINEKDISELSTRTLKNWFHRQIDFGSFQPITGINFPRTFKKTTFSSQSPIQL